MKRIAIAFLFAVALAIPAHAQTVPIGQPNGTPPAVILNWTASVTPGVGYNVFRATATGQESGTPALNGATPITGTTFTDTTVTGGQTYFYTAAATLAGAQSKFSNEITAAIPVTPAPPTLSAPTISISTGPNNTKIVAASYTDTPGVQTAYQFWSGSTLLKSGTPTPTSTGAYTFSWKVKKALLSMPSLTVSDATGKTFSTIAE